MKVFAHIFITLTIAFSIISCEKSDIDINDSKRFIKFYGNVAEDKANAIIPTSDQGFMITGTEDKLGEDGGYLYLNRVDANGNSQYQFSYKDTSLFGGLISTEGHDVHQLENGNYLVLGSAQLKNDTSVFLVLEVDNSLNIISEDTIMDANHHIAGRKIIPRTDGSVWLTGTATKYNTDDLDLYRVTLNTNGTFSNKENLGIINSDDIMGDIVTLPDNSTIWCGTHRNSVESSLRTFKLNENGGILYDFFFKQFNETDEFGYDITQGNDNNLYHVGKNANDGYFVITQTNGVLIDEFSISDPKGQLSLHAITPTKDGKFVMTGKVTTSDRGAEVVLYRISKSGKIDFRKYFGGLNDDEGIEILEMPDNGYAILATSTIATGNNILMLVRTDENGEVFGPTF